MSGRIRWEPGAYGILNGHVGTVHEPLFTLDPDLGSNERWQLDTLLPVKKRAEGEVGELKDTAEVWLQDFVRQLDSGA